ncbi:hypothetical protein IC582_012687 [Cucumis melo]
MAYILMPVSIINSISISRFENPILSFPPSSKIRRKPPPPLSGAFKRSPQSPPVTPSPCRDPPKDDMSVAVPMGDESLPNSRSSYTVQHKR